MPLITNLKGRVSGLFVAGFVALAGTQARASANVDCSIDDKFLKFEMEAIAGRTGPIVQVNVGSIEVKPATGIKLTTPQIAFDRTHISQQWLHQGDLKLNIEAHDEKALETVVLIIEARLNRKTEKFAGSYVLRIDRDQTSKEFKGRIKECIAG